MKIITILFIQQKQMIVMQNRFQRLITLASNISKAKTWTPICRGISWSNYLVECIENKSNQMNTK
jgi:hypothetical protein